MRRKSRLSKSLLHTPGALWYADDAYMHLSSEDDRQTLIRQIQLVMEYIPNFHTDFPHLSIDDEVLGMLLALVSHHSAVIMSFDSITLISDFYAAYPRSW